MSASTIPVVADRGSRLRLRRRGSHRLIPLSETLLHESLAAEEVGITRGQLEPLGVLLERTRRVGRHSPVVIPKGLIPVRPVGAEREGPLRRRSRSIGDVG